MPLEISVLKDTNMSADYLRFHFITPYVGQSHLKCELFNLMFCKYDFFGFFFAEDKIEK